MLIVSQQNMGLKCLFSEVAESNEFGIHSQENLNTPAFTYVNGQFTVLNNTLALRTQKSILLQTVDETVTLLLLMLL